MSEWTTYLCALHEGEWRGTPNEGAVLRLGLSLPRDVQRSLETTMYGPTMLADHLTQKMVGHGLASVKTLLIPTALGYRVHWALWGEKIRRTCEDDAA